VSDQPDEAPVVAAFSSLTIALRPAEEEALREAVCNYVAAAKKAGMTPEQIIVVMRNAAQSSSPGVLPSLMQRVVDWCLEKYFEAPTPSR
jgi:hypothetical protein